MSNQLSNFIQKRVQDYQAPAAMTHVIYGYPSIQESLVWMEALLSQGVDILEVQFPFSDPVADGPTIVHACHKALKNTPNLSQCLHDISNLASIYPNSKILFMSYLNPVYRFGIREFVAAASKANISGLIIPDLPIEQACDYKAFCQQYKIAPIWLITPATPKTRVKMISEQASEMLYCVSRSGVTGQKGNEATSTPKNNEYSLANYLASIREHTPPSHAGNGPISLAVGFGIHTPQQVAELANIAEVAIVGSALLEAYERGGVTEGLAFIQSLFPYLRST